MPRKRTAPKAAGGLTFLVATNLEKPDENTRKLIRSHVMVGKNAGRKLPSKKREWGPEESSSSRDESMSPEALPICRRFASSRSAFALADTVEPGDLSAILQLSSVAKQFLFALEPVMFFERRNEDWIRPLTTDAAYLHCQVFNAHFFSESLRRNNTGLEMAMSPRVMSHYIKALRLLSERIEGDDIRLRQSNSTLATMVGFASHAMLIGDLSTAGAHIDGICRIVQARGGTQTFFGGSEKLLGEILRCDLGLALVRGSKPIFTTVVSIEESILQYPDLRPLLNAQNLVPNRRMPQIINGEVTKAWNTMANFCKLINFAAATEHRITTATFLDTMAAMMYRLLSMDAVEDSADATICLGLLAFSSGTFLQWRSLRVSYGYLASICKKRLRALVDAAFSTELNLWVLMTATMSVLDEDDDYWIQPMFILAAENCRVKTWKDVQDIMHQFLWIDLIHNEAGRVVYERLTGCSIPYYANQAGEVGTQTQRR